MSSWVTEEDVRQILGIGLQRHPHEACGLLITGQPVGSSRLREVQNKAEDPCTDVLITAEDFAETLRSMIGDPAEYPGKLQRELVVWHTHPGGHVGPSKADMDFRKVLGNAARCMVVTIPTGEAVQF